MNFVWVKEKSNNYTVALFLYATLIVDLIRKIGWGNVDLVRNIIYILVFLSIIYSISRLGIVFDIMDSFYYAFMACLYYRSVFKRLG